MIKTAERAVVGFREKKRNRRRKKREKKEDKKPNEGRKRIQEKDVSLLRVRLSDIM